MTNLQEIADRLNEETKGMEWYVIGKHDNLIESLLCLDIPDLPEVLTFGNEHDTEQQIRQRFNALAETLYKNRLKIKTKTK